MKPVRYILHLAGMAFCLSALLLPRTALCAEPKRVLLIYDSVGYAEIVARDVRSELEQRSPDLLEVYSAPFVAGRADDESLTSRYADYLGALFPDKKPDLVATVGSPAMNFFRQFGRRIFPSTPMLAIVEESRVPSNLGSNETVATTQIDLAGAVENILRLMPETNSISVVVGSSPLEKSWEAGARAAFAPFQGRVSFRWLSDLSFGEILDHAATLPPHSAILFYNLLRDAAGVAYADHEVVSKLHAVAKAPIFTFDDADFGEGIVGGPAPSTQELSRNYADVALRILRGDALGGVTVSGMASGPAKFDWRETQRWSIPESRLPPGSMIYFRDPSAWERYRFQILAIGAAIFIQAALISWLLHERRYRHRAERMARDSMTELTQMNRIAAAGEISASIAHEVNQPLTGMVLRAEAALRWLTAVPPDIARVRDALSQIVTAGHRASEIVASVRSMFKKDTGQRAPVDVNRLITAVLALVQVDLERNGIELQTQLDAALPDVMADNTQLQQVMLNLVMNAIEAMHSRRPRVLTVRSSRSGPNMVHVSVEDTGTGIDPADLDRIFKPMFTTKERGMGMGLAICSSIIESHEGRIWVTPGASGGSIFQFELPISGTAT